MADAEQEIDELTSTPDDINVYDSKYAHYSSVNLVKNGPDVEFAVSDREGRTVASYLIELESGKSLVYNCIWMNVVYWKGRVSDMTQTLKNHSTRVEDLKSSRQVLDEIVQEVQLLQARRSQRRAKSLADQLRIDDVKRDIEQTLETQDTVLERLKQLAYAP